MRAGSGVSQAWAAASTAVRHYTDGSDNPGWIADTTTGTETRYTESLGGDLGAQITTTGTTTSASLTLVDLHGDITATATIPATGNAVGIGSWSDTTEYGTPRTGTTTPTDPARYNWLGGKQRATDTTGLLLMGARLYNPTTGRFTSPDPVVGGNENTYNYPNDPIGMVDLDGRWGIPSWSEIRDHVSRHRNTYITIASVALAVAVPGVGIGAALALRGAVYGLRAVHAYRTMNLPAVGIRVGARFTSAAIRRIAAKAVGKKCPHCGVKMTKPQRSVRGQRKDMDQVEMGYRVSRRNGGNNSEVNMEPICARYNNRFGSTNM